MVNGLDKSMGVGLSLHNHLERGNKLPSNPIRRDIGDNVIITTYDNLDMVVLSNDKGSLLTLSKSKCSDVARELLIIANTN